jgi:hypothetical protein
LTATGLSANPQEYRERLEAEPDERIDAWVAELMRDISIRRGVRQVMAELREALGTNDDGLRRLFSAGGGPAAAFGRTENGEAMVPAISLRYFVPGIRSSMKDARTRLIEYLVASFHEIVYI